MYHSLKLTTEIIKYVQILVKTFSASNSSETTLKLNMLNIIDVEYVFLFVLLTYRI